MNLTEFHDAQQEFAAVVKEALAYGPDPGLDVRFRQSRARVQSRYPEVRSSFSKLWTTSSDPQRFHGQHTDPVENILASPTLEGLLKRDQKQIQRDLEDIETAFELCREDEVSIA